MIVAVSQDWAIGNDNGLLFHIPADLRRFKELTSGHHVLMGRKTYESLPVDKLPNRINTVLTRDKNYPVPSDVFTIDSVDNVLSHYHSGVQDKDLFIIGGSTIYSQFINHADEVLLTYIDKAAEKSDTFFNRKLLEELFYITDFKKNYCEKNDVDFYYVTYKNKQQWVHRWDEFKD